jgi:isopentenyl-diphosphate delta-isomerase
MNLRKFDQAERNLSACTTKKIKELTENVILVDSYDNETGIMPKMEAHVKGLLHRAFSVFIFNSEGELLLQQRALDKYHSGGKWTNTCCSHPRLGEETIDAANRRLMEEMGMECDLQYGFNFIYKADMLNGIAEHEFDHVFFGLSNDIPKPEAKEVANYKYIRMEDLEKDIETNPSHYTEWLKICFNKVMKSYLQIF